MTLAVILVVCVSCSAPVPSGRTQIWTQPGAQQSPPAQSSDSTSSAAQSNTGSAQNPPASETPASPATAAPPPATPPTPAQTPSDKKTGTRTHRQRKKTSAPSTAADCAKSAPTTTNTPEPESAARKDGAAAAKTTPTNCPPPKTVVHEGGTTEPSIQLLGGTGGQQATAGQRSTTDQLVESTEQNLKKIAGRALDANQQEMLKQIQQFLDQSKAAVAAGDVERGRNLALKAHLLSDELAKP